MATKKTTKKKTTKQAAPAAAAPKKRRKVKRSPKPAAKGKRRLPGQASVDAREFSALTASQRASILEVLRREGRGAPVVRSNPAKPLSSKVRRKIEIERDDIHATAAALRDIARLMGGMVGPERVEKARQHLVSAVKLLNEALGL